MYGIETIRKINDIEVEKFQKLRISNIMESTNNLNNLQKRKLINKLMGDTMKQKKGLGLNKRVRYDNET